MTLTPEDANAIFTRKLGVAPVRFNNRNHPRNGIKLIACLLDAGITPHLFGFDLQDRGDNSHYFDDEIQVEVPSGGHMPSWEYQILHVLKDLEFIRVHNSQRN